MSLPSNKGRRIFVFTVAAVLLLTGSLKLASLSSDSPLLQTVDGVTGLSMRSLFLVAGIFEAGFSLVMLSPIRPLIRLYMLRMVLVAIAGYRVASALKGTTVCPCLGVFNGLWISTTDQAIVQTLLLALLGTMVLGNEYFIRQSNLEPDPPAPHAHSSDEPH